LFNEGGDRHLWISRGKERGEHEKMVTGGDAERKKRLPLLKGGGDFFVIFPFRERGGKGRPQRDWIWSDSGKKKKGDRW